MNSFLGFVCFFAIVGLSAADSKEWPDPDCPYPQNDVFRLPYPGDCTKYWECFDGSKYVQTCPEGLEFNAPLMECDTPEIANCDHDQTTASPDPDTTTDDDVVTKDPMCPYPSHVATFFPNPEDCTTYFECYEGDKYLQHCPDNLYWSQTFLTCTYKDQADCGDVTSDSPTPTETTTDSSTGTSTDATTEAPTDTPTDYPYDCPYNTDVIIFYPYEGDCTKYWECFAGEMELMQCPPGLEWNRELEVCDYPDEANCVD